MRTIHRAPDDAGYSLTQVLLAVIITAVLAAAAWPMVRAEQLNSLDSVVVTDIERYATAAERAYSTNLRYPTTPDGFNLADTATPAQAGRGNQYRAFVVPSGAEAGWVIYGRSSTTGQLYLLTSYNDGEPLLLGSGSIPMYPPMGGTYGLPASIAPDDWDSTTGTLWGDPTVWTPTEAGYPVMDWTDPTYQATTKTTVNTTALPQVSGYFSAPFRLVDVLSPVTDRAIEVVTDSATHNQGVILQRAPASAALPADVAAVNERWSVSAFVKAPSGTPLAIGCRYMTPAGGYVSEASTTFTGSGSWQRPAFACPATTTAMIGTRVAVQVYTTQKVPGTVFHVTAPQVNKGAAATPFKDQ